MIVAHSYNLRCDLLGRLLCKQGIQALVAAPIQDSKVENTYLPIVCIVLRYRPVDGHYHGALMG